MCIITAISLALGATSLATAVGAGLSAATGITAISTTALGAGALALGEAAIVGSLASGALGVVSGIQDAEARKAQALYQADLEEKNARMDRISAENLELQSNQKRVALLREMQEKVGAARSGYAANGVVLGSGTSAEYEADARNAYDLDLKNFNYDVASEKWKRQVSAVGHENQANLFRASADNIGSTMMTTSLGNAIGAFTGFVNTTAKVGERLSGYKEKGKNR